MVTRRQIQDLRRKARLTGRCEVCGGPDAPDEVKIAPPAEVPAEERCPKCGRPTVIVVRVKGAQDSPRGSLDDLI